MLNGVNLYMEREQMALMDWELLLEVGWDRVGTHFFHRRFDHFQLAEDMFGVIQLMPLRYRLNVDFKWSKSQRSIFKRNADLTYLYRPAVIDDEKRALFDRWYEKRFSRRSTIESWVSTEGVPFTSHEVCIFKDDRLVAVSFFDVTYTAQYSTLAFYEPTESRRSLGILTMMLEILHGLKNKKNVHYPGHAYYERSIYEYKKQFHNAEYYNWDVEDWQPLTRKK